jgi:hypothetical protein
LQWNIYNPHLLHHQAYEMKLLGKSQWQEIAYPIHHFPVTRGRNWIPHGKLAVCSVIWTLNNDCHIPPQSVKNIGLELRHPVFKNGKFYFAASRCTSSKYIIVPFPECSEYSIIWNIVHKNVTQKECILAPIVFFVLIVNVFYFLSIFI